MSELKGVNEKGDRRGRHRMDTVGGRGKVSQLECEVIS